MEQLTLYKGVIIFLTQGYFSPSVNPEVQYENLESVLEWIDNVYLPLYEDITPMIDVDYTILADFILNQRFVIN